MDNSQQESKHQHLHRQAHRLKPDRRKPYIRPVEKCGGDYIHRISKEAAEHKSPEGSGYPTEHKHFDGFPKARLHVLKL